MQKRVLLLFCVLSALLISPVSFALDPQKEMDLQVARDLIGPRGLFYSSKSFLGQFTLGISTGGTDKEKSEALIDQILNSPQTDRKIKALKKRLLYDKVLEYGFYRERLAIQLELAYKHGTSLELANRYIDQTQENHRLNFRYQRSQAKDLSFLFGTLTNIGLLVGNNLLGGPAIFTSVWPILGLGPMMVAWKFGLAYPLSRHSRTPLNWARKNLKEQTANMGEAITDSLGLPRFSRPRESLLTRAKQKLSSPTKSFSDFLQKRRAPKERPKVEVVQIATHQDGSPILVTQENLLASINFRNTLPIYKGRASQIIEQNGLLFYPSTEIKTQSGLQTVLKGANLQNQILIPESYRTANNEDPLVKLETLKKALIHLLESPTLTLPLKHSTSTSLQPCTGLVEIGKGGK